MNSLVSAEERWRRKLSRIITGLPILSLTLVDTFFSQVAAHTRISAEGICATIFFN
jgi:hypothetical protein